MEIAATVTHQAVRCTRWYVPIAAEKLPYPSNPVRADRSIAAIATVK
jgi:hypothetical protein